MRFVRPLILCSITLTVIAQNPVATDTATVEGVVLKQGTTDPIPNTTVTFSPVTGTEKTATSDQEGKFKLESLPPGRYRVAATRTGFVRVGRSAGPANLTLAAGQLLKDVRLQLAPGAVVTGRVLDENGQPKSGAVVTAVRPQYENGLRILSPCAGSRNSRVVTDTEGAYRLFNLEPGEYYLSVAADTNRCSLFYYPGVIDPADAVSISTKSGQETAGIELRLKPIELHTVRFKVEAPQSTPSTSGRTQIQIVRRSRNGLRTTEVFASSLSRGGVFTSPGLPAGSYEVFYDNGIQGVDVGHIHFDIVDRDIDAGTMVIKPAAALAGQVRVEGAAPPGWSVSQAQVQLRPLDGRDRLFTLTAFLGASNRVSADGTFLIAFAPGAGSTERSGRVAAGRYQIELLGLGADLYTASAKYAARDILDTGLVVDGPSVGPIEITLQTGGSVEGVVRNAKDEPVADSRVAVVPADSYRGNLSLFKDAATDQYGRFTIRGVAPGEYTVLAWDEVEPNAWTNSEFLREFEQRGAKVTVRAGTPSQVTVRVISR